MSNERPDLNTVRTQYQVADDTLISYRPRAFGAIDIPFTGGYARTMTKTEGALLDTLTRDRGLAGLQEFKGLADSAFSEGVRRFPDNPVPGHIAQGDAKGWQGNDGHRDAFRHAYWNALMTQKYGEAWASAFGTAHEGTPDNKAANREAMDLYNNEVGRSIGANNRNATPEQLAALVEQAVNQGKLVVIDRGGNLEWSDRVTRGQHGLAPENDIVAPHLRTPGAVSTDNSLSRAPAPATPGQAETQLAANANGTQPVDAGVERMLQDRRYAQIAELLDAKGLDKALASRIYAETTGPVARIEVGNPVRDAGGNADRNLFVYDGSRGPLGENFIAVSENQARATTPQMAAVTADTRVTPAVAAENEEPQKAVARTA